MTEKEKINQLSREALEVLKAHFGERVSGAGGSFDSASATLKFRFSLAISPEQGREALRQQFNHVCHELGLLPSDFDLQLTLRGQPCQLERISLRSPTWPFVVKTHDGKLMKVNESCFMAARARAAQKTPVREAT